MIVGVTSYPRSGNAFCIFTMLGFGTTWKYAGKDVPVKTSPEFVPLSSKEMENAFGKNVWINKPSAKDPLERAYRTWEKDPSVVWIHKTHHLGASEHLGKHWHHVYVIRDGRDAVCSFARYLVNIEKRPGTLVEWQRKIASGKHTFPEWNMHIRSWQKNRPNAKVLRYEQMLLDAPGLVKEALESYGYSFNKECEPLSFEWMKQHHPFYFAKGKSGTWKTEMDDEARKMFEERSGELLKELGYEL